MIARLLGLFRGAPNETLQAIVDPVLGRCVPDQEERWWRASVEVGGRRVVFTVGGALVPDPALLARASQFVREWADFEQRVAKFLRREAAGFAAPEARAEIARLTIDDVCLFWPERPNDGMIFFTESPDDERHWRCAFAEGRFHGLGFDT